MRAERILKGGTEPRVLASPVAVLLTMCILAEWEVARDAVLFPEERVDLCRIIQATFDEQKNLVSWETGRKNDQMTPWWRLTFLVLAAVVLALLIANLKR
jgi:flagellar biosynthesis/type III secretory pathway M-ring protein FliF/YscJ